MGSRVLLAALTACALLTGAASAEAGQYLYVANSGSDDVSQYRVGADGALTPLSPARVAAGDAPSGVVVHPDGRSVYVTNTGDDTVSQYHVRDGTLSPKDPATIPAGIAPQGVAVDPNRKYLYVIDRGLGYPYSGALHSYRIDSLTGELSDPAAVPSGVEPRAVAVSPDGESVYVANNRGTGRFGAGNVMQYAGGRTLTTELDSWSLVGNPGPRAIAVSPDGENVFVTATTADGRSGELMEMVADSGGVLSPKDAVESGFRPNGVAVSPDGKSVYVAASPVVCHCVRPPRDVWQYSVGASGELTLKTPHMVHGSPGALSTAVAVNPDGKSVYVTSSAGISQYDVRARGKLFPKSPVTLKAGKQPTALALTPPRAATVTPRPSYQTTGGFLAIKAAPGAKDNLVISRDPEGIHVTDLPHGSYAGSPLVGGARCESSGENSVVCNPSGIAHHILVHAGDRGDKVVLQTGRFFETSVRGGRGDDVLIGGSSYDNLTGGSGADVLIGRGGTDELYARDLRSDKLINCRGGGMPGLDTAYVDKLPLDPDSVVVKCAFVSRY